MNLTGRRTAAYATWKWINVQGKTGGSPVYRYSFDVPWEPASRGLSDLMMRYWTTLARTGDPYGPGLPQWPRHTGEGSFPVMHLDVTSHAAPDALRARYEELDAVLARLLHSNGKAGGADGTMLLEGRAPAAATER